jgi:hypothetical protein
LDFSFHNRDAVLNALTATFVLYTQTKKASKYRQLYEVYHNT